MKRFVEYLLIITLLLPMIHDLRMVEEPSFAVVADGGQLFDEPTAEEVAFQAPPKTLSIFILLKATTLRRFAIVRVKCLRLLRLKPIIKSEAARHSEMWTGDVSSMRI